ADDGGGEPRAGEDRLVGRGLAAHGDGFAEEVNRLVVGPGAEDDLVAGLRGVDGGLDAGVVDGDRGSAFVRAEVDGGAGAGSAVGCAGIVDVARAAVGIGRRARGGGGGAVGAVQAGRARLEAQVSEVIVGGPP